LSGAEAPSKAEQARALLARYCFECHGQAKQEHEINFAALLTNQEPAGHALNVWRSALMQVDAQVMPPEGNAQPSDAQRGQLRDWLQRTVEGLEASLPRDAGRAPIRRLNRTEYNNTVRDLIGIDLRPADQFPADDVSEGFDNQAEALSLPPLLFEKYLEAAERIVDAAVVAEGEVQVLQERWTAAQLGRKEGEGAAIVPIERGGLECSLQAPAAGHYEVSLRAWRSGTDPQPAVLVLMVDGIDSDLLTVTAEEQAPQTYRLRLPLRTGQHKLTLKHVPPAPPKKGEQPRPDAARLHVEELTIAGPEQALSHRQIFVAMPGENRSERAAARAILDRFAVRAFRRPLQQDELDRLIGLVETGRQQGKTFVQSVRPALLAVLISPHFLWRVERDQSPLDAAGAYRVSDWELASRLSYFLWSSMPDEELFQLARQGRLSDAVVLDQQLMRMLADAKSQALVDGFPRQWLELRKLDDAQPDRQQFKPFNETLRRVMREEVRLLFDCVVREDRSIQDLLIADYTFLNDELAKHYGISGVEGPQMRRVSLTDRNRGGVLTMAAVLTATSYPTRTSPVKRGQWILETILGAPAPPPPPNVPDLEATAARTETGPRTLRERLEQHRADVKCAGCHRRMDTLGLGLEHFDAIGRWREKDEGRPIDASGVLPGGQSFRTPGELKSILAEQRDEFARNLTQKMFVYALGRSLAPADRREVNAVRDQLAASDYRFSGLIRGIIHSYPFQYRKAAEPDRGE
jgi:hypothetical protein